MKIASGVEGLRDGRVGPLLDAFAIGSSYDIDIEW